MSSLPAKHAPAPPSRSRFAAAALLAALALSGCANQGADGSSPVGGVFDQFKQSVQGAGQRLASAAGPTAAAPEASGPRIEGTPLFHLFTNAQYDTTKPFATQYPRVALTVLTSPPSHNDRWMIQRNTGGCWSISATVWRSRASSQPVAPFTFCIPRDGAANISLADVIDWGGRTGYFGATDESTGNRRTDGPVPPSGAFPTDVAHKSYWAPEGYLSGDRLDGLMVGSLLVKMGFDWSIAQDRRVWITRFVAAAGS